MTQQRRQELIRAEALRHCNLARLDEPRRREHMEVAEALEWAVRELSVPKRDGGTKTMGDGQARAGGKPG